MKYASCTMPWLKYRDRFMSKGYAKEEISFFEILEKASKIPGVDGIEINYAHNVDENNVKEVKDRIESLNLGVSCLGCPVSGEDIWTWGSLTSPDKTARKAAISRIKSAMDIAYEIGAGKINLWTAQDGYDYPLEMDYEEAYSDMISGIKEAAGHRKDVKVCLEYKLNEPRRHIMNSTIGKALYLINKVNMDNVGILLDFGHAYQARENPAESVYIAASENKLFHVHINDNLGFDDDDMMAGGIHFTEFVDFVYWLKKCNYQEWLGLDLFPIRENGERAVKNSIAFFKGIERLIDRLGVEQIKKAAASRDVTEIYEAIWKDVLR